MFKEFFTELCREVFDTDRGLWLANKKNELYPNPHAYATERESTISSSPPPNAGSGGQVLLTAGFTIRPSHATYYSYPRW